MQSSRLSEAAGDTEKAGHFVQAPASRYWSTGQKKQSVSRASAYAFEGQLRSQVFSEMLRFLKGLQVQSARLCAPALPSSASAVKFV